MVAPRARSNYVSSPFLEALKNGQIRSNKYRSKAIHLEKPPHVVVMTNAWPQKTPNDEGLSNDRYTYLHITGNDFEWSHGYKAEEVGAFAPGFNIPAVTLQIQTRKSSQHIDHKENKGNLTPADTYVKSVQEGHGSRKFKRWLAVNQWIRLKRIPNITCSVILD